MRERRLYAIGKLREGSLREIYKEAYDQGYRDGQIKKLYEK